MILGRHIPTDWNTFLPPHDVGNKRRVMMCGRKAMLKYAGIPGISTQANAVANKAGWCFDCVANTAASDAHGDWPHDLPREVHDVYDLVQNACMQAVADIYTYAPDDVPDGFKRLASDLGH